MLHQEERSNISQSGFSQAQSSKNVTNVMKINLISADSPGKAPYKRNSNKNFSMSFRNSNASLEQQRSGNITMNRNELNVEPNNFCKTKH